MPVDYSKATSKKVYEFVRDAATKADVQKTLKTGTKEKVSELLHKYGVEIPHDELPTSKQRQIPSELQCRILIAMFKLDDQEYAKAQYDYNPSSLAPLIMVIGHAMPLVATVDSEVAAAG